MSFDPWISEWGNPPDALSMSSSRVKACGGVIDGANQVS